MGKVKQTKIQTLVPDNRNFNKGTEYGTHLMEESVRKFGLGRSILIDKNDRIIAGNKTFEKAGEMGFENVVVVETDGHTLVAVKRTDIDLDTTKGREFALADNATSKANLSWDNDTIKEAAEAFDFDPTDWGVDISLDAPDDEDEEKDTETQPRLVVECDNAAKLSLLYNELQGRGFTCDLKE